MTRLQALLWQFTLIGASAIALTFASFLYTHPLSCREVCSEPAQTLCPTGTCRFGEQQAGFPFPMVRDHAISSPTGGWGKVGLEDSPYTNFLAVVGNILVYSVLLWFVWVIRQVLHSTASLPVRLAVALLFVIGPASLMGVLVKNITPQRVSPLPGDQPHQALLGTWRTTDTSSVGAAIIRFYDNGGSGITLPRFSGLSGEYTWLDEHTIRIRFVQNIPGVSSGDRICAQLPGVLRELCQTKIYDPSSSSYPPPAGAMPVIPVRPRQSAYPLPSMPVMPPQVYTTIEAVLTVKVDSATLTLTNPAGATQTFRRVTGDETRLPAGGR